MIGESDPRPTTGTEGLVDGSRQTGTEPDHRPGREEGIPLYVWKTPLWRVVVTTLDSLTSLPFVLESRLRPTSCYRSRQEREILVHVPRTPYDWVPKLTGDVVESPRRGEGRPKSVGKGTSVCPTFRFVFLFIELHSYRKSSPNFAGSLSDSLRQRPMGLVIRRRDETRRGLRSEN